MTDNNKTAIPSLAALSKARQNASASATKSLSSLKQNLNNQSASSSPSLATLAATNATKKPLSSLQTLAQRANTGNTTPSLVSLAKKPVASTAKAPSLIHLASRQATTSPGAPKLTSLTGLASKSNEPSVLAPPSPNTTPNTTTLPTFENKPPSPSIEKKGTVEKVEDSYSNPLCAKPSFAAQFLFAPVEPIDFDAQAVFSAATTKQPIPPFDFDQPSPDDIVLAAQSNRSGAGHNKRA